MRRFINLTPNCITMRSISGTDTIIPASGNIAQVNLIPGKLLPGFWARHQRDGGSDDSDPALGPVPVFSRPRNTKVMGLPESVLATDTILVTNDILIAIANEERNLESLRHESYRDPGQYHFSDDDKRRQDVLRACVAPGTAPWDEPVTDDNGNIIAVTRLIDICLMG